MKKPKAKRALRLTYKCIEKYENNKNTLNADRLRWIMDLLEDNQSPFTGTIKAEDRLDEGVITYVFISTYINYGRGIKLIKKISDSLLKMVNKDIVTNGAKLIDESTLYNMRSLEIINYYLNYKSIEIQNIGNLIRENLAGLTSNNYEFISKTSLSNFINKNYDAQNILGIDWEPLTVNLEYYFERTIPTEPTVPSYVVSNQKKRYNLANTLGNNSVAILDVGCGSGWGTSLLLSNSSPTLKKVVGIDIDEQQIMEAQELYGNNKKLKYIRSIDMMNDFSVDSFDLITSFEMLEHVTRETAENIIKAITFISNDSSIFVGTTPIVKGRVGKKSPGNPYHIYEYSAPELYSLLKYFYSDVEFKGIGTQGSLAFIARYPKKDMSLDKYSFPIDTTLFKEGLDKGANEFFKDAVYFLKSDNPVWAIETALRSLKLKLKFSAIILLIKSAFCVFSRKKHIQKLFLNLGWRREQSRNFSQNMENKYNK